MGNSGLNKNVCFTAGQVRNRAHFLQSSLNTKDEKPELRVLKTSSLSEEHPAISYFPPDLGNEANLNLIIDSLVMTTISRTTGNVAWCEKYTEFDTASGSEIARLPN